LALLRGQYLNPTIEEDENGGGHRFSWNIQSPSGNRRFPKVPSDEGRKLMESGVFGTFDTRAPNRKALARRILDRELGLNGPFGQKVNQGLMAQVGWSAISPGLPVAGKLTVRSR
jgi:WD repeat-containing protein 23